jgi:hypothetical protein
MVEQQTDDLAACIDKIESGYEYMLAYAAQGRAQEKTGGASQGIRSFLENIDKAMSELPELLLSRTPSEPDQRKAATTAFIATIGEDATRARQVVQLVLAAPSISSRLVDNLNASTHIRALLTDIFLIDESLKGAV